MNDFTKHMDIMVNIIYLHLCAVFSRYESFLTVLKLHCSMNFAHKGSLFARRLPLIQDYGVIFNN